MTRVWRYAMRSEVGLVRSGNEDAAYAGQHLIAVADGMGGHAAGEVASAATIAALTRLDRSVRPGWDTVDAIRRAVRSANATLRDIVAADRELHGMGTTVTAAMLDADRLVLAHVGDSRAYLLRDDALRQLTVDHTYVQQLVDDGRIEPAEMSSHPQRNLITRSIDGRADLDVDVVVESLRDGDRFLICSDGLSGVLSDETLGRVLGVGSPDDAADELMALALRAGGPDNITCIVADVEEVDEPAAVPGQVAGAADDADARARSTSPAGAAAVAADERVVPPEVESPPAGAKDPVEPLAGDDPRLRARALRRRRTGLLTAGVLVVLALAMLGGWSVVKRQYYVGASDNRVAIFKGVHGSVLGLDLSSVHSTSDVAVSTLPDFEREQVTDGIHADGLADAEAIVTRLRASVANPLPGQPPGSCPQMPVVSPTTGPSTADPRPAPSCAVTPLPLGSPSPQVVPASPR